MADNTVYINRVRVIPTSTSDKGIYLYVDPDTEARSLYVVANNVVTDMLLNRITTAELTSAISGKLDTSSLSQILEDYITIEELTQSLLGYITSESLTQSLLNYTTNTSLNTVLSSYVTSTLLNTSLQEKVNVSDLSTLLADKVSIETVNQLIEVGLQGVIVSSVVNVNGEDILVSTAQEILNLTGSAFSSEHLILNKVGGLVKGSDYTIGTTILGLLNSMFFPNIGKTFPQHPIFIGFSETYPTIQTISELDVPTNYYEFDYNKYTGNGYITIALPGINYLKRIEDTNGLNIIGLFDLIYKSIQSDIYNVYVSPLLHYNDNLELTLTTKIGSVVQSTLSRLNITINQNILPILNSISVSGITRSIINGVSIGEFSILNSVDVTSVTRSIINSISVDEVIRSVLNTINVYEPSILNSINVSELVKSELNSISVEPILRSILNSVIVTNGASKLISINVSEPSILNSISVSDIVKSVLNTVSVSAITRSVLNSVNVTEFSNDVNLTYTFTNEDAGSAEGNINLECTFADIYKAYWADDNGLLPDMSEIATFDITHPTYSKIQNIPNACMIPELANAIIIVDSDNLTYKFSLPSGKLFNQLNLGNKLYSFGLVADVHCGANTEDNVSYALTKDIPKTWQYFTEQDVNFVCGLGDIEDDNISTQITAFANVMDANNPNNLEFYSPKGNNDYGLTATQWYNAVHSTDNCIISYGDPINNVIDPGYTFSHIYRTDIAENDIFLFQSVDLHHKTNPLETAKRTILESTLAANTTKRIFYFMHMPMAETVGDVNGILGDAYPQVGTEPYNWFMNLMANNKNVIHFSGHTHYAYESAMFDINANAFNGLGAYGWSIHIPSLGNPRVCTTATEYTTRYDMSQGAIVEVYANAIILRGVDFGTLNANGETYDIDTHIVPSGLLLLQT